MAEVLQEMTATLDALEKSVTATRVSSGQPPATDLRSCLHQ